MFFFDYSVDGDLVVFFEGGDGGGVFVGGDFCCVDELGVGDVVLVEDVFLGCDDVVDVGGDEVDYGWVGGGFWFDEDGWGFDYGFDGFEIGGFYCFVGFFWWG